MPDDTKLKTQRTYHKPDIKQEFILETKAGSVITPGDSAPGINILPDS